MARQRRAFKSLPEYLKTKQNDREYAVLDDVMFEPENADFLLGFIGSGSLLTPVDLERTPLVQEDTAERQKYQLSIGATYVDPETQDRLTGAFYTDLLGQISANGGIVDDPNRVFATNFYAWTPPFDFDKHINFSRYFWMVEGSAADVNGVYITKEPEGSLTVVHEFDGVEFIRRPVKIVNGLPPIEPAGTIVEDADLTARLIFRSDGANWVLIETIPVADIPTDTSPFLAGEFIYVGRTGPEFNRPLVWLYSHEARRWISQPVVVSSTIPDTPREGMVWEDIRIKPQRILKRYTNGVFVDLNWMPGGKPTAAGNDGDYIYDDRNYRPSTTESADNEITDPWASDNWWRHFEDLSPSDRNVVESEDQAVRPIIEFWAGIEPLAGDIKDVRNDPPSFQKYAFILSSGDIVNTGESTTIFQYQVGTSSRQDVVLEFPLVFNNDGEFLFDLTLETDASTFEGYKYFKDTTTGYVHSIWTRSDTRLEQTQDADGLYDVPKNLSSNPDHVVLTEASRAQMLNHMTGIIGSQDDFTGTPLGPNSYRWSDRNPTVGATIIDPEQTLLRAMGMLQTPNLDFPTAVRRIQRDYNKVIFRFENKLEQFWNTAGKVADPAGTLLVPAADVVDAILTDLFTGRTDDFPYFYSGMGTYDETRIDGGIVFKTTPVTVSPIYIPPSPPRVGASQAYKPTQYTATEGVSVLRGHEGYTIRAYDDDRNLVWLELQNRFFDQVQDFNKDETPTYSSRFTPANFHLTDFYGNYTPFTSIAPVDEVVQDLTLVVAPVINLRVFAKGTAEYASWDGNTWLTRRALTDDIFFNNDDGEYYIYNGKFTNIIQRFERSFDYDYSTNEYRNIIRREFERLLVFESVDFTENNQFDVNDKFTWNYGSAGVEGNYRGQYRRLYNTIEPQLHAWEVMGYSIEPDWWRTEYVPDSTAPDGTPRYGSANPMWADFQVGIVNPISGLVKQEFVMAAPIPVDSVGELLDPIAAGIVDEGSLDNERIDDSWRYGDGAPVEQTFYDTTIYPYVVSLAGYLMKNGVWVDTLWSEVYITIGEQAPNTIATAPHTVHRDTSTRPAIGDLPVHLQEDDEGNVITRLGVNAWVSEYQQLIGASPTEDFGKIIQNTQAALAWQTSGYINVERTIISTLSGNEIPFDDVHNILYHSQPIETHFCSGVIITRESNGYRVFGTDPLNPSFQVDAPVLPNAIGQVEQRQSFTAEEDQHDFIVTDFRIPRNVEDNDTTKVAVMADGQRIKPQHIRVTGENTISLELALEIGEGTIITVSIITTPSNPSTQVRTFKISGVGFSYAASGTGNEIRIEYGRFFSTSTEVINFMLGYGRVLEKDGWVFDTHDDLTGKTVDWMFGAQKFAAWVMDVESMWNPHRITPIEDTETFTFSPIEATAKFVSEFGSINNVESIQNGAYGIINVRSEPIETGNTFTSRTEDTMVIDATGDEEIYGVRINIIESQHVVFLSNITRFNDVIYDPVLAIWHETLRVDSYRTNDWNGRMEADGYMIDGGVLLPNFEKQAFDFTRFYDRIDTPDNPVLREQARNLYGWAPNDSYMDQVEAADRTRFDYFRGMIQTKGTLRPITAYTRGTRLGQDNVFVYEDWAWKLQPFGDQRVETVQFNVDKIEISDEAQVICFGAEDDPTNRILEIQDFNRRNTVVGTVVEPVFYAFGRIEITNASNTLIFINSAGVATAKALVAEINTALDAISMVGVVADVIIKENNQQLAFRNTDEFIGTDFSVDVLPSIISGSVSNPAFVVGDNFSFITASNNYGFTSVAGGDVDDIVTEINIRLANPTSGSPIVEFEAFNSNDFLGFRNTSGFAGEPFTLVAGTPGVHPLPDDLLSVAGVTPGTYQGIPQSSGITPGTYNIDNDRWITPPFTGQTGISNIEFPIDSNGFPSLDGFEYFAKVFDTDTGITQTSTGHFDPEIGEYEQGAFKEVDYDTDLDPARYNVGPEVNSSGLAWGEEQVGQLWWDTTRRLYVDYRRPIDGSDLVTFPLPDYETSSAVWGSLLFYHTTLSRDGSIATAQTFDIFNGDTVAHGLSTGDIVSTSGANEPEWNIDDIVVELGPVSVTGTKIFQEQEAAGTIFIPSFISVSGDTIFDENNEALGSIEFAQLNSIAGDTQNPTFVGNDGFGNGDNFRMYYTDADFVEYTVDGTINVIGIVQEINAKFLDEGIQNTVEAFNDFDNLTRRNRLGFRNPGGQACKGSSFRAEPLPRKVEGSESIVSYPTGTRFSFVTASNAYGFEFNATVDNSLSSLIDEININTFDNPPPIDILDVVLGVFPIPRPVISAGGTISETLIDFSGVDGSTLTSGGVGDYFDISSTTNRYRVWFDDTTNTAPLVTTEILVQVSFTGGDTDQQISDSVVVALITADLDFSTASNSATTVVSVTIVAFGLPIVEVRAFDAGGRLGFTNNDTPLVPNGQEGEPFTLIAGDTTDLLAIAGISPGTYQGLLQAAGFAPGDIGTTNIQEIIPGEDFDIGTGADFSLVMFSDLLSTAGIGATATDSRTPFTIAPTVNLSVVDPVFVVGDNFEITVKKNLSYSAAVGLANITALVLDVNIKLGNVGIDEVRVRDNGGQLEFYNVNTSNLVSFELQAGGAGDILTQVAITPGTYTNVVGTATLPLGGFLAGDDFIIDVSVVVNYTAASTSLGAVIIEINNDLVAANITDVTADDNLGGLNLRFQSSGNLYSLRSTKRLNYVNQLAGNATLVVSAINSAIGDNTDIIEVEAFFEENKLSFRNSLGNEGIPYFLNVDIVHTGPDLLALAGITPGPRESIPVGLEFNLEADGIIIATPYITTSSVGLDELVSSINEWLATEGIISVQATNVNDRLTFVNTSGNGGVPFLLDNTNPGMTTSLLDFAGISVSTSANGFFSIIPALSDFTIETSTSGGPLYFFTPTGGNLTSVVNEINLFLEGVAWTELPSIENVPVEAAAVDNKLVIRNTDGFDSRFFELSIGTIEDLLTFANITPGPYGPYPAGYGFAVITESAPVYFVTEFGGSLDAIVEEFNNFVGNLHVPEVEAVNTNNFLTIRNTTGYAGSAFTLIPGGTAIPPPVPDLLDLVGIFPVPDPSLPPYFYEPYISDPTKFTFTVEEQPPEVATGNTRVNIGAVDLYEWVVSPVPPDQWEDYTGSLTSPDHSAGVPLDVDDASYVERKFINSVGNEQSVYYFWVKGNDGSNPEKNFSSSVIANVLASPISRGVPWFAPMDANYMNIYTGGITVEDSYAIEVTIDRRDLDSHIEWVLVSEGDQFKSVPNEIVNKLIDSMSMVDEHGSTVPAPWLSDTEKMGACLFPIQTVYNDVESAIETYVESLNAILDLQNLGPLDSIVEIFPLSDEFNESTNPDGYWMRQDFILSEYKDDPIFDTVVSIAERDFRGSQNAYANGDLIKVEITINTDPFEEAAGNIVFVGATYVFQDGLFLEIGIDNHTVNINTNIQNDTTIFRSVYSKTYDALITGDQNDLMFSLLHEMNRQNITCDWFIKTSYISTQVFDQIIQSGYVRPDETLGIINNINDVKPFRTKLRSATSTLTISGDEDVPVNIFEFPVIKIGLVYDRLSCNMIDDGGWDSYAWDTVALPGIGWDRPLWEFEELGTEEWYIVEDRVADGLSTIYVFTPAFNPELYQQRVTIFDTLGNVAGKLFDFINTPTTVTLTFNVIVPPGFVIRLEQTQGFYQGGVPTLGTELEDTLFEPIASTYEHAVPRTIRTGSDPYDPRDDMLGCTDKDDELGGRPEERIVTEVIDSCKICVTNTSTEALAGWDATPWGTAAWDSSPADVGDRVFFMCIGSQEVIPPGVEIFPTSEDFSAVDAPYIIGSSEAYVLVAVKVQVGGTGAFNTVTEGIEYEKVEPFNNILVFGSPIDQEFIADGMTTIFNVTIPTGLSEVRLNGVLLADGVDYIKTGVIGNEFVDFLPIQPPPTVVVENSVAASSSVEADGSTTEFEINLPSDSLTRENVFVWKNTGYVTDASNDYDVDTSADVVFVLTAIPAEFDIVRIFGVGNDFGDNTPLFSVEAFNGNNINTSFTVGNNATLEKTFVFVDGDYKNPAADYTIASPGTASAEVQFFSAPPTGVDNIEIRVIVSPIDIQDIVEETFVGAAGSTTVLPTTVDATDPERIMLFRDGVFQDLWTALGTPDATLSGGNTINWLVPLLGGETISFRMIRSISINETTFTHIVPVVGDVIDVFANPYLLPGDIVKFVYNGWPVGPLGPFEVTSIPVPADEYDVVNGVLTLDAPVEDDTITITYKEARKGDLARSILSRMPIVVDEILIDHLIYDAPLGFEINREIGTVVVDITLIQYFQWDGTNWNVTGVVGVGDQFFVKKTCEIWEYDGTSFKMLFEIGDAFITPPVLNFPPFGQGITFGTYAYGSAPDASLFWPDAYQIMQHPGSCES